MKFYLDDIKVKVGVSPDPDAGWYVQTESRAFGTVYVSGTDVSECIAKLIKEMQPQEPQSDD